MRALVTVVVLCAVLGTAARAACDPAPTPIVAHTNTDGHLVTDGGTDLRIPPSYIVDVPTWKRLDAEMRRLQDAETRLTAENASLARSASGWQPGWKTLAGAIVAGAALGFYLGRR